MAFCSSGICLCYGVYGFLQESLFSQSKLGATFMLVTQTVGSIIVALIWRQIESSGKGSTSSDNDNNSKLHHPLLCLTSSIYVFAMAASNESLQFVSYPTAVLAKSCKMIPTMVRWEELEYHRNADLCLFASYEYKTSLSKGNGKPCRETKLQPPGMDFGSVDKYGHSYLQSFAYQATRL
jgi:hypothetical protein